MNKTKIEWCDSTWNPVTGCLNNCPYCYARKQAKRFGGWVYTPGCARLNVSGDKTFICTGKDYYGDVKETEYGKIAEISSWGSFMKSSTNRDGWEISVKAPYPFGFTPTFHKYRLDEPAKLKKPSTIFVCSMADLFGDWVPDEWIGEVFKACEAAPQHRYLFLTKNPKRYIELFNKEILKPQGNIWYGVTITSQNDYDKLHELYKMFPRQINLFVSVEPIQEKIIFKLLPDWVIIGAETGKRKNKVIPNREWIENIVSRCVNNLIPVFMKNSLADIWGKPLIQEFPWRE